MGGCRYMFTQSAIFGTSSGERELVVKKTAFIIMGMACLMACGLASAQGAVRIESQGMGDTRIPIAVPNFGCAPGLEAVAKEMTQAMRFDLEFTGLFVLLPSESVPAGFTGFTEDASKLDFAIWRELKVEHLVYAFVTQQGGTIQLQCRLFDTMTGAQVVGQLLSTESKYPRLAAHRFSEEIVRFVDGTPGVASSEICFSAGAEGKKEIYMSDYDGANPTQVTRHGSISIKPKISPDGRMIAYLSYKDRYPFLYIFDRQTGKSTPLSKSVGLNAAPAWAPDGKSLAYVQSKDGNPEIYINNVDGSNPRRITNDKAGDTSPTFSPNGNEIAFVSDRSGNPQVFVMGTDGSNIRRVTFQGGSSYDPVWSPDGKSIAYVADKPGDGMEIYTTDLASGTWVRLTDSGGSNESPSWSPDSRHIVFSTTRDGKSSVYAVTVATGQNFKISTLGAACQGPTWGPRRG